jgi:plasmid stabilization system protein ParE
MRIVKFPKALKDLVETAEFIAEDNIETADRFFEAFESTIELIRKTPKIGSVRKFQDQLEVRMWFVSGFERCLIFYTQSVDEIAILRVIHSARDYTRTPKID